ncbi:MAG: L-lactate dehydrogenase [Hyphomicrobiales bacterium]|nr:L-lactate dehydrogenase [Hyphomicrobiales bacterium]MCC2109995.1 L-lactate dehydrogenase [Hyphomicrobiales bacterium]
MREERLGRTYNVIPVAPADYRRLAEQRLPRFLFDYIDGGANAEVTLAANAAGFRDIVLRQRVMRDVSTIDTSTVLSGEQAAMPVILAPVGMAGMMARRGETQAVRAANATGVPFTLSTVAVCDLAEVKNAASKPFWFQLYMMRDREVVKDLLARAEAAGCTTLAFTVDLAVTGLRHRDLRNGALSQSLRAKTVKAWEIVRHPHWLLDVALQGKPHGFGNLSDRVPDPTRLEAFTAWVASQFDTSVTWKDIEWLRSVWKGRLLIKGVLEPDDARAAVAAGADGVIVSNHGGRQLDGVASSISKLPGVVAAVGGHAEVYMDGGVRSGVDVFKAVALGARGVMIGRPWVWALAAGGEKAVSDMLAIMRQELRIAMALSGINRIDEIGRDAIDTAPPFA